MTAPSETELDLLIELRDRISDLKLDEEYLQPKNLVRFLRARGCNLSRTEEMIRKNVEWLEEYDIKNVLNYEPLPGWETNLSAPITGFDKEGGPMILLPIGSWDPSLVTGLMEDYVRWGLKIFETVCSVIHSRSKGKDSMNQFTIIVDLKGLGWKHYTNYAALYGTLMIVRFFEAHYPETLRRAFMINAPTMFGMFWKLIKPIMSPATHAKLQFLSSDPSTWMDAITPYVNEDQFHEKYGGTLPHDFQLTLNEIAGGKRSCSNNGNVIE